MDDIDAIVTRQAAAGRQAARVWCEAVLGQAVQLAPIMEGTLRGSGRVDQTDRPDGGADFEISFSTVYAARQHEELDWKHPRGGQAKYLEEPFKRHLPRLAPALDAAIRA